MKTLFLLRKDLFEHRDDTNEFWVCYSGSRNDFDQSVALKTDVGDILCSSILDRWCDFLRGLNLEFSIDVAFASISPYIHGNPSEISEADPGYIAGVINKYRPDVIVVLGVEAARGLFRTNWDGPIISGPSPICSPNHIGQFYRIARELAELQLGGRCDRGSSQIKVYHSVSR